MSNFDPTFLPLSNFDPTFCNCRILTLTNYGMSNFDPLFRNIGNFAPKLSHIKYRPLIYTHVGLLAVALRYRIATESNRPLN